MNNLFVWNEYLMRQWQNMGCNNIAIVGNGPVSAADNEEIRRADVVIRFNNWGSRKGLRESQSQLNGRCDIVLLCGDVHTTNIGRNGITMPSVAVQCIPYPHNKHNVPRLMDEFYPEAQHCILNPYWYGDSCREIGIKGHGLKHPGIPTVGFSALYHLHRMDLVVPRFYVTGFTWNYDEGGDTFNGHPPDKQPSELNHRFYDEAKWAAANLFPNPRWEFSEPTTEALKRVVQFEKWGQ